jgi:hypothetical protein
MRGMTHRSTVGQVQQVGQQVGQVGQAFEVVARDVQQGGGAGAAAGHDRTRTLRLGSADVAGCAQLCDGQLSGSVSSWSTHALAYCPSSIMTGSNVRETYPTSSSFHQTGSAQLFCTTLHYPAPQGFSGWVYLGVVSYIPRHLVCC